MSAIRLLISDIDGTLVRHDKSLSEGVIAAARRAQEAGLAMSLISARPPSGMLDIAARLGLTGPIAAFNGGTIVRPDGGLVSTDRLPPDDAARTLTLLDRPGVMPWLYADGRWYATTLDNPHVAHERIAAGVEPIIREHLSGLAQRVDKIVGVSEDHDLLVRLEPEVAAALGDRATVGRSQPYYLDVTARRGNKGDGIATLAEAYGVGLDQVAVLGDQRNDLPMFARAALSVAMGQAPDEVKTAATHVARSNDEDGVADAILRFVLPAAAKDAP